MHLQVCGEEEKGENTRVRLHHLASTGWDGRGVAWRGIARRGEARRWVRAHDVSVNSPQKSDPKPYRPTVSFCRLILL
jgi:hypothetical protein